MREYHPDDFVEFRKYTLRLTNRETGGTEVWTGTFHKMGIVDQRDGTFHNVIGSFLVVWFRTGDEIQGYSPALVKCEAAEEL